MVSAHERVMLCVAFLVLFVTPIATTTKPVPTKIAHDKSLSETGTTTSLNNPNLHDSYDRPTLRTWKPTQTAPSLANCTIVVVVLSDSGEYLAGADVSSYKQPVGQLRLLDFTNSSGMVSFPNIPSGNYSLLASKNGFFNSTCDLRIDSGATLTWTVPLTRMRYGNISYTLVNSENGAPAVGVTVGSYSQPYGQPPLSATTDYRGQVTFNHILIGEYFFHVRSIEYKLLDIQELVYENQTINSVIEVRPEPIAAAVSLLIVSLIALLFVLLWGYWFSRRRPSEEISRDQYGTTLEYLAEEPHTDQLEAAEEESQSALPATRSCPHCGSSIKVDDAEYCSICGGSLIERNAALGQSEKRDEVPRKYCTVCDLEIEPSDEVVWCPYCGSVAHKTHMLEWLHVKDYCPMCRHHLDLENLKNKEYRKRHTAR